jgi:hypothetical protein
MSGRSSLSSSIMSWSRISAGVLYLTRCDIVQSYIRTLLSVSNRHAWYCLVRDTNKTGRKTQKNHIEVPPWLGKFGLTIFAGLLHTQTKPYLTE